MRPGDRLCYFVGYLPTARLALDGISRDAATDAKAVDVLADFMLQAGTPQQFVYGTDMEPIEGLGLGHLLQEKLGQFRYKYFFTKAC